MTKAEAVTAQVRVELLDHLRDLQKHGPRYINEYVASIVGPQTTRRPVPHLHPKLAELVRELALDAVVMDQRTCGAASPIPDIKPDYHGRAGVIPTGEPSRETTPLRERDESSAVSRNVSRPDVEKRGFAGTMVV